jgi:DNA-binding GntR family transcriptional regulator
VSAAERGAAGVVDAGGSEGGMAELTRLDTSGSAVSNGTGAEQVYRRLREAILHGRLAPGRAVSQVQLARELGVSRTPLREAVRMLQRDGLVSGEANRMVRVATFSIRDVEELYAVRIANEALAIRLTVPLMTDQDDAYLKESLDQMAALAALGDVDSWELKHRTFHTHLVRGGGTRLCGLLSEMYDHAERYRRIYITSEPRAMSIGAAEHEGIVDACRLRDAPRAAAELARHLSRTALMALMQIAPEHEPAMVRATLRTVLDGNGGTSSNAGIRSVGS